MRSLDLWYQRPLGPHRWVFGWWWNFADLSCNVGSCSLPTYLSVNSCIYSCKSPWKVAFAELEDMEGVNERSVMFNTREFDESWRVLFNSRVLGDLFWPEGFGDSTEISQILIVHQGLVSAFSLLFVSPKFHFSFMGISREVSAWGTMRK